MNPITKYLILRREARKDRERIANATWLDEYSKEMREVLKGTHKKEYKGNPNFAGDD